MDVVNWIDSHCHLDMSADDDLAALLERARAAGVTHVIDVGTDLASSRLACENARSGAGFVRAAVGLHPHDASRLEHEWADLVALSTEPGVVAIGETGFDLHYNHSSHADQEEAFRRHIRLAHERDLALVIHTREAWADTFRVLQDEGVPPRTVFHCFTGGPAEAEQAVALGACCSFSGIVSFRNAEEVRAAAALVPADRLLAETDSPYLAPVPMRGQRNEPAYVTHVGAAIAEARGVDIADVARATTATAVAVFGIVP